MGDIVFARRAVRSDAARGQVDKLSYPFTGPWRIVSKLHGTSYEIEHCTSKAKDKKHASDLSPYPAELILFRPLDGADNQFGQLNRKFKEHPYKEAGITGFNPPTPFVVPAHVLTTDDALRFAWPTLAELNEEIMSKLGFDLGAGAMLATLWSICRGSIRALRHLLLHTPTPLQFLRHPFLPNKSSTATTNYFSSRGRLDLVFANGDLFMSP